MLQSDIQQLRGLPIESVAERLGLRVRYHKSLCPFHEDDRPSLSYNSNTNRFKCFACGAHGDTIDLARKVLGTNFTDTCSWLADNGGVIISEEERRPETKQKKEPFDAKRYEAYFTNPTLTQAAKAFLFDERNIDPEVVSRCRLSSWNDRQGTQWLQIPYFDAEGRLTGIQNRLLCSPQTDEGQSPPRFMFPKNSRCGIYNLPILKSLRPGDSLYITEGCSDCWAMLSSGHKAVAIPSATMLQKEMTDMLKPYRLHMYPDRDQPGEHLFLQLKERFPDIIRHQLPEGCKDYSDYYKDTCMRSAS